MAAIPARLGRYRLLKHVASGGMADVFRAKSTGIAGFEKILAIKLIRPNIAQEPRFIRSFIDEARIAVTLNHRNIVQVFDFGKAEHRLFIAMELIEGIDLRAALRAATAAGYELPAPIACYIVADLAAGLDYAHRKTDGEGRSLGIVHCDVSPHNVMLSYEGFVKILDFGVARARFATTTEERRLRGKPRYMAPEQTRGEVPSPATDSFALGIVAWELFTGLPLFEGDDVKAILRAVRRVDAPAVHRLNPDVPRYLSDAIEAALRPDPSDRIGIGELAEAAGRAARELATTASSRALADWLALIRPVDDAAKLPIDEANEASSARTPVPVPAVEPGLGAGTRTNVIVASDLVPESDNSDDRDASADESDPIAEKLLRERRHVVTTCAILEGDDPELTGELVRLLAELAYKRGAVVQENTESSLCCVFGLELAGEDDVGAAMQYSLDATEMVRETTRQSSGQGSLGVRLGTRAGVIAQRRGEAIHIRGSGLEDARTLARAAEPGHPLLSGGAGRLASAQFAFRELSTRRTGGRRLRAFELLGPRSFEERARVLTERRGRFIGRQAELAKLGVLYERALDERRELIAALVGPGGVGKSRLVAEFVARHPEANFVAVATNQTSGAAPFSTLIDLLQAGVGLPPGRGGQARAHLSRRLHALLEPTDTKDANDVVATLQEAMEMRDGALLRPVQATVAFRDRVTAAFRKVRNHALPAPRIIILENLQWADAASIEVFRAVTDDRSQIGTSLVIGTARPDSALADIAEIADLVLAIVDLEGEDRHQLITSRLGESLGPEVAELVAARAGGNPLMIEEVCTAVREFGPERIPNNARDIVLARVDALPVPVKMALQYAAVAAPTIRSPILQELLGPDCVGYLGELIEEGLLVASDYAAERGDASELRFRHGLIAEVVYESLSAPGRRRAHRKLGELLAARADAGREERPAEVATHLERGGSHSEAARFWLRAGQLALAAFDADGAVAAFSNSLRLSDVDDGDPSIARDALLGREQARSVLGEHEAQAADQARLLAIAGDDSNALADVKWRIARRLLRLGDYPGAIVATEEAEEAARRAGDERLAGEALLARGEIYERSGEYVKGLNAVSEAAELFRRVNDPAGEMRSLVVRGRNCVTRSRYSSARDAYQPVLLRLETDPDPLLERVVRNHIAVIELCCGDFEAAMASVKRSVQLCEELGDRAHVGDNLSVCGIVLLAVGAYADAADYLDRALSILEETKSRWSICDCRLYRGVCAALMGDANGGIAMLEEAIAEARELGARYVLANALTELAGVLLRRDAKGDSRAAEAASREAHSVARDSALVGIEILALSRHAEATVRLGNTMSAVALSTRAIDLLSKQEGIEGPEEEIYYTHCQLLRRTGDNHAEDFLAAARESLEGKLERLSKPQWRTHFTQDVGVNAAILLET